MFKFVSKKEYWDLVGSGISDSLPKTAHWHMKSIQDAVAYSYLHRLSNKDIAEIGGGNSRLLPALARTNRCFNIEEFQGVGCGPTIVKRIRRVTNLLTRVGKSAGVVGDEQFDSIFSVSVVEHVPDCDLTGFFDDCYRILRPSGLMLHLIDVYLEDNLGDNAAVRRRVFAYSSFLDGNLFEPLEPLSIVSGEDVVFRTSFATNPDNAMEQWNRIAPQLTAKRERAQGCTLLMAARKTAPPTPCLAE